MKQRWKEHKYFNLGVMLVSVIAIGLALLAVVITLRSFGL